MPLAADSATVHSYKSRTKDGTKNLFFLFRLLGYVMPEKFQQLYVTYGWLIRVIVVLVAASFSISFFKGSGEMDIHNLLSSIQFYLNVLSCVIRIFVLYLNREYIFKIEAILDKLDSRLKYPEEFKEAARVIKFGNRAVIFFIFNYVGYATVTLLAAIVNGQPPYGLYIPYLNRRDSIWNLAAISALEYTLVNVPIVHQLTNDVFPVVYVGICNSHLKMLIVRVLRIGTDLKATKEDIKTELVQCVLDHKLILQLISTIDPLLSAAFFVQFVASTMAMCIALVNITISEQGGTDLGTISYVFCLLIQTFWVCYYVTTLTDTGNRLPEAIFQMSWTEQDKEFRRLLLFFMQQSQKDIVLYAGKLFPISVNTFLSMNKFAFSLYTMLNKMDIGKRIN